MDNSKDISDKSPIFIVSDSQGSDNKTAGCTEISSTSNISQDQTEMGDNMKSPESVLPSSSSSEARSNDTSLISSKDNSSEEKAEAAKEHALYLSRSERANKVTQQNVFRTSTPMIQSCPLSSESVEHLTPVENISTTSISQQGESEAKETSSSDNYVSPSVNLTVTKSSEEETGELVEEKTKAAEDKACSGKQPESTPVTDLNNDQAGTTLPRWQEHMSRADRISPTTATLTKSSSDVSTVSSRDISTQESSLHQWQSSADDSDCDMFATDIDKSYPPDSLPKSDNLQALPILQHSNFKGLLLPQLSQDIFQPKPKGVTFEKPMQDEHSCHGDKSTIEDVVEPPTDKLEPSSTDVILLSQDDVFCLHLTQSQSSQATSQALSQPDRLTSSHNDRTTVNKITPPCVTLDSTILKQTPIGHPSTTGHHEDIGGSKADTGKTTLMSNESSESTRESVFELTREDMSEVIDLETRADSKMNESTESIESGLVGFHFDPPTMLLKPVPRTSPSCLETSSETIQDSSQHIDSIAKVRPVSPDMITTSSDLVPTISKLNLPTLSLSVPVPADEDDTDEIGFKLQKDVLDVNTIAPLPAPVKSIFTNVRERFKPRKLSSHKDDEYDPFAFRDEVYRPSLRKHKRISRNKEESSTKKRKSGDTSGINGSSDDQVWGNNDTSLCSSSVDKTLQQSRKERFLKIVKTRTIRTTTKVIETHVVYARQDGTVITEETKHESSEPECEITNENETREEVDEIPSQITFSNLGNTEENLHVETRNNETTSVQRITNTTKETTSSKEHNKRNSKDVAAITESSVGKPCESTPRQNEDLRNNEVARQTMEKDLTSKLRLDREHDIRSSNEKDVILVDSAESSVIKLSESPSAPSTSSPPLFPASSNSASSTSSDNSVARNLSSTEESSITQTSRGRQTTRNALEPLPKPNTKRKRSLSVDNQITSRRSSTSPCVSRVFHEGTRVFARWYDKHYYPGHVVSKRSNNSKYHIKFDDGNESNVLEQCIIAVDYLPRDQPIMFCKKAGDEYIDGVIEGFYKNGDDRGYKVLGVDNKVINCSHSNVLLSSEQAAIFLSLRDSMKTQHVSSLDSSSTPSDDRENLIKTSRRSCEKVTKKSRTSHDDKPFTVKDTNSKGKVEEEQRKKGVVGHVLAQKDNKKKQRCKDGAKFKKALPDKESPRKKRRKGNVAKVIPENVSSAEKVRETVVVKNQNSVSETPKSSRKSTGEKIDTNNSTKNASKDDDVHVGKLRCRLSTVMKNSEKTHPIPTRRSPRKLNSRSTNNENLILPTNKDLFRGYGFIFTGSDAPSISNQNSPQEHEQVYIRDDVITQIKTGGGEVLDNFLDDYPRNSCFLLSNVCQTTAKYFNALVLGIPCLSHAWVRDCCVENRLISFKSYLLPAGKDLITERLVEEQNYGDALRGLKVHLVGGDDIFKKQWTKVLIDAGCQVIQKLRTNILQKIEEDEFVCDVIVVRNGHVAHSTIQKARLLNIPTVTIHWVKQCILTGVRVDFNAHHSFIYRVEG